MLLNKNINHSSKYYFYKMIIDIHLALNNESLAPQVKDTLIFFCINGINTNTYKMILYNKIATSLNIIHAYKTKLYSLGLINKIRSSQWEVCDFLKIKDYLNYNIKINCGKKKENTTS